MNIFKMTWRNEQFNPSLLGIFINPFFFARKGLYKHISMLTAELSGNILDIGCGQKPYERLCIYTRYVGLEIDSPENHKNKRADFFYDGVTMPFQDGEFDSVLSNQVFEHVFNPEPFLAEINRVLKAEGKLLMTVPFVWDEHEQPFDYARYSSFGLKHLLEENGFEILVHKKSCDGIETIFQLINAYLYKITIQKSNISNLFLTVVLMAPFNIAGVLLSKILPRNPDLYLDNVILAKKVRNV